MKRSRNGFTLLEVMIGLALLGFALSVLINSAANSISASQNAHMMGVVTDLARGKMYEIEEKLLKEGFTETDQSEEDHDFTEEGWPNVKYDYKVEQVELPSWDTLQAMAKGQAQAQGSAALAKAGSGSGSAGFGSASFGAGSGGGFENSALGGMLGMMGGFGGGAGDASEAAGASLISGQYSMFQDILKVAIRKVTLTMRWKVLGRDQDPLLTVAYFTDQSAMDKVLKGFGSTELPDDGGAGSGSGSGAKPRTPTRMQGAGK